MAMRELDEKQFDYVVYGTGLTESILAAALGHAGASVLHLDCNDFYGASSATFSLQALEKHDDAVTTREQKTPEKEEEDSKKDDIPEDAVLRAMPRPVLFPRGFRYLHTSSADNEVSGSDARRIFVDISPRLLMSSGPMVDMMVGTKVGHYLDFRALEGIYMTFQGNNADGTGHDISDSDGWQWKRVPASRADVFQDKFVTMLEKRLLMRYVKSASAAILSQQPEESSAAELSMSFEEHMKSAGLTDKLQGLLVHGIVLGDSECVSRMNVAEAKERILTFQKSLMRFPNTKTPLLYPNYGTAEIAQAFCRACAVQGGTYLLRRALENIVSSDDGKLIGCATDNGEFVKCKAVFAPATNGNGVTWRCACVIDSSIISEDGMKRALFVVPKDSLGNTTADVRIMQIDSDLNTCPKGSFLLYAQTVGMDGTESDIVSVLNKLVQFDDDEEKDSHAENKDEDLDEKEGAKRRMPIVRWGITYSREILEQPGIETMAGVEGVHLLVEGGAEMDAEFCVKTAKLAFEKVLPDEEFFREKEDTVEEEEENAGDATANAEETQINGAAESTETAEEPKESADATEEKTNGVDTDMNGIPNEN